MLGREWNPPLEEFDLQALRVDGFEEAGPHTSVDLETRPHDPEGFFRVDPLGHVPSP